MKVLGWIASKLRDWMGFGDGSGAPLTPGHGWLLPVPVEARRQQSEAATLAAARADGRRRF
jgi:hypothetical protein